MTTHRLLAPWLRQVLAVLLVVTTLLVIELLDVMMHRFNLHFGTLAPVFVVLVYAVYIGGLRTGLVGGGLIIAYSLWQIGPNDPARFVVVALSVIAVTVMVGLLQRKAEIVDTLNGNIIRLRRSIEQLDGLLGGWYIMSDPERQDRIRVVRHDLSQLATLVIGWHRLAQEKDNVTGQGETDDEQD